MAKNLDFFEKPKKNSIIKSDIVSKYFDAWSKIILKRCNEIYYLDLYSGTGKYNDKLETFSTPLKVFDKIEKNSSLHSRIHTIFYEKSKKYSKLLEKNLNEHPVYEKLKYKPIINNISVDESLAKSLKITDGTFCFVDPQGYKGVSRDLLRNVTKNWGCDCVFYLSNVGIKRNIPIEEQKDNLISFFGLEGYKNILEKRHQAEYMHNPDLLILEELESSLKSYDSKRIKYFLPFCFKAQKRKYTSHYITFITKKIRGFSIMKDIMAKSSLKDEDGFPRYYYSESEEDQVPLQLHINLVQLKKNLCHDFQNEKIEFEKLVDKCDRLRYKFVRKNYIIAILELKKEGLVKIDNNSYKDKTDNYIKPQTIITFN